MIINITITETMVGVYFIVFFSWTHIKTSFLISDLIHHKIKVIWLNSGQWYVNWSSHYFGAWLLKLLVQFFRFYFCFFKWSVVQNYCWGGRTAPINITISNILMSKMFSYIFEHKNNLCNFVYSIFITIFKFLFLCMSYIYIYIYISTVAQIYICLGCMIKTFSWWRSNKNICI